MSLSIPNDRFLGKEKSPTCAQSSMTNG